MYTPKSLELLEEGTEPLTREEAILIFAEALRDEDYLDAELRENPCEETKQALKDVQNLQKVLWHFEEYLY